MNRGKGLPAEEMTIRDTKQDEHEDEEEEECSRGNIHDGGGKADGDVAEVGGHDDAAGEANCDTEIATQT